MRYQTLALALILSLTLLRVWVAQAVALSDVEAYYWTWSTQLSWSYFDHGPVVALLIRLGTALLGHSPLGVRLPFILISALTMGLAALLTRRLCPDSAAIPWTVAVMMAMPVFLFAGGAANPDVPWVALVLVFVHLILNARQGSWWWIPAAGLVVGISFCTKYFGAVLIVPLLYVSVHHARPLRATCAAVVAALSGALPVLYWNWIHGGASFGYHLQGRHSQAPGLSLENLAKLIGGQLGYLSPLVLVGILAAGVALWRCRQRDPQARVLLWVALPLLLSGYLLILLVPSAEPHWPVAGYLPLAAMLGALLPRWWNQRRNVRIAAVSALIFSGVVGLAFHLHVLTDWGVRLMPAGYVPRYDLSNELRGWPRVGAQIEREIQGHKNVLVGGCHYTTCAQLKFTGRGSFNVVCPSPRMDQFDFMPGGDGSGARNVDLIYVKDDRFPFDAAQLYLCDQVQRTSVISILRGGRTVRRFELHLCRNFQGLKATRWPPL